MKIFEEDEAFIEFFADNPEYIDFKNYFVFQDDHPPVLIDFDFITSDTEFTNWTLTKKSDFWTAVGIWYYFWRKISIVDPISLELSNKALANANQKKAIEEVMDPLKNLQTDKEKFEYLLRIKTDIETVWEIYKFPKGKRGWDDQVLLVVNAELEFYERKIKTLGLSDSVTISSGIQTPEPTGSTKKNKLTYDQIALIYFYNGIPITRENCNKIGAEKGKLVKTAGEKLYQRYSYFSKRQQRIGEPVSPTELKTTNRIKLLESILSQLNAKGKNLCEDEINILKNKSI